MKDGKYLFLKIGLHVNQQIPAGNDIHSRKRGIADEVMKGKNAQIAYNFGHPIEGTVLFRKTKTAGRVAHLRECSPDIVHGVPGPTPVHRYPSRRFEWGY